MEEKDCAGESEIREYGKVVSRKRPCIQTMIIAGQIEGHQSLPEPAKTTKYEHVLPQLVLAEESDEVDGVMLLINTVGGDVEAGLAMAEMIAGMKKPVVSMVLGGGHSIGIPLAVSADLSFMAKSATMTVHPVRINGLVLGVPQSFEYLSRMQDRISDFIVSHSAITAAKLEELMRGRSDMATDIGSILDGEEAVACGLIDRVGTFSQAMSALRAMAGKKKRKGKTE